MTCTLAGLSIGQAGAVRFAITAVPTAAIGAAARDYRIHEKEANEMGARQKLNSAHLYGALVAASVIVLALRSWVVFVCALLVMMGNSIFSGGIRLKGRRR